MAVRIEQNSNVWTIIHDRPEAKNAMDPSSADALVEAFEKSDARVAAMKLTLRREAAWVPGHADDHAFTARSLPYLDEDRYSARKSRQGKSRRIGVRLNARLVLSHDFHISADYPGLGADHIHLFTRITSDIENCRIASSFCTSGIHAMS